MYQLRYIDPSIMQLNDCYQSDKSVCIAVTQWNSRPQYYIFRITLTDDLAVNIKKVRNHKKYMCALSFKDQLGSIIWGRSQNSSDFVHFIPAWIINGGAFLIFFLGLTNGPVNYSIYIYISI